MKKIYDSSKSTREHIIRVGEYIDIIIEELRKYKKANLIDDINKITVVDLLYLLLYGESLPFNNKLLKSIYHNSISYRYEHDSFLTQEDLLKNYINELLDRKNSHDRSKLEYPEKQDFDKYTQKLRELSYGSEEYRESLYQLRNALSHHYRYNRHHPEHFGNGIYGMTIMDLTEMICDWKASSERQDDGDVFSGILKSKERFNYDNKMVKILSNTAEKFFENGDNL